MVTSGTRDLEFEYGHMQFVPIYCQMHRKDENKEHIGEKEA